MFCKEENCDKEAVHNSDYCEYHYRKIRYGLEYLNRKTKEKNQRYRDKLFQILGGTICNCKGCLWHKGRCVVSTSLCLQFDHLDGGGSKDQREHGALPRMWKYYVNHPEEAKRKLQVLCVNCNWIKRIILGETQKL